MEDVILTLCIGGLIVAFIFELVTIANIIGGYI